MHPGSWLKLWKVQKMFLIAKILRNIERYLSIILITYINLSKYEHFPVYPNLYFFHIRICLFFMQIAILLHIYRNCLFSIFKLSFFYIQIVFFSISKLPFFYIQIVFLLHVYPIFFIYQNLLFTLSNLLFSVSKLFFFSIFKSSYYIQIVFFSLTELCFFSISRLFFL